MASVGVGGSGRGTTGVVGRGRTPQPPMPIIDPNRPKRNRDLSLIATSSHRLDSSLDAGVAVNVETYEPHRARILFQNTTGTTRKVFYAAIYGNALVRTQINKTRIPSTCTRPVEYTSKNIYTAAAALAHATDRARRVLFGEFEYSFALNTKVAVGVIVRLIQDQPAIDTTAIIMEADVDFDRPTPLYRYRALGLTAFDALTGVVIGSDTVQPQRQLAIRPTRSDIVSGTDGDVSVALSAPVLAAAATQRHVALAISRQTNVVASSLVYDLQIQFDGSGWYSLGAGGAGANDWRGALDAVTTTAANTYTHESLPFGGTSGIPVPRTYNYRVRSRTTASTSDWSTAASVVVAPLVEVDFASGSITAPKILAGEITADKLSATDIFTMTIAATEGTIGGWEINTALLTSRVSNAGKGVTLDHGKNRASIYDDVGEKVVIGYLSDLPKHDGTGNWGASDYGFWAKAGDKLRIDGDADYIDGTWRIVGDSSYLIEDGITSEPLVRLGTRQGQKGLFINETDYITLGGGDATTTGDILGGGDATATGDVLGGGDSGGAYHVALTPFLFYVGTDARYIRWDGSTFKIRGTLEGVNGTFSGALSAATGTFSGALSAATGTFSGALSAATGTFSGALSAATGTFSGALSAATGTFSGELAVASTGFSFNINPTTGITGTLDGLEFFRVDPVNAVSAIAGQFAVDLITTREGVFDNDPFYAYRSAIYAREA